MEGKQNNRSSQFSADYFGHLLPLLSKEISLLFFFSLLDDFEHNFCL